MPVAAASLANLKEPWKPGVSNRGRNRDLLRAIKISRNLSPPAMLYLGRVLNDESLDHEVRIRAAQTILQYGMPKQGQQFAPGYDDGSGIGVLRVEFVTPEKPVTIEAKQSASNGSGAAGIRAPVFEVDFVDTDNSKP